MRKNYSTYFKNKGLVTVNAHLHILVSTIFFFFQLVGTSATTWWIKEDSRIAVKEDTIFLHLQTNHRSIYVSWQIREPIFLAANKCRTFYGFHFFLYNSYELRFHWFSLLSQVPPASWSATTVGGSRRKKWRWRRGRLLQSGEQVRTSTEHPFGTGCPKKFLSTWPLPSGIRGCLRVRPWWWTCSNPLVGRLRGMKKIQ